MKILIVGINYLPELTGIGKYTGEMSEWLVDAGNEVSVITASPYYPNWKVQEGYSASIYHCDIVNGVKVMRCPFWVPKVPSSLKRILHLSSFAVTSFPVLIIESLIRRPDVIVVIEPPFFCAPGVLLVSAVLRIPAWLHVQDFEFDAAFNLGFLKNKILKSALTKVEVLIKRSFARVSSISPSMVNRLIIEKKVPASKARIFPNWADLNQIRPSEAEGNSLREELDIPSNKKVLLYSGNIGNKQGIDILIEAARRLTNVEDILFLICGDGAYKNELIRLASGLPNVSFIPLQPLERLNALLNLADIHLLPQRADAAELVMPSKLTGMLASGKPVVATAFPDTALAEVVRAAGSITIPPGEPALLATAITELLENEERSRAIGAQARQYAESNLGKDAIISSFVWDLESATHPQIRSVDTGNQ